MGFGPTARAPPPRPPEPGRPAPGPPPPRCSGAGRATALLASTRLRNCRNATDSVVRSKTPPARISPSTAADPRRGPLVGRHQRSSTSATGVNTSPARSASSASSRSSFRRSSRRPARAWFCHRSPRRSRPIALPQPAQVEPVEQAPVDAGGVLGRPAPSLRHLDDVEGRVEVGPRRGPSGEVGRHPASTALAVGVGHRRGEAGLMTSGNPSAEASTPGRNAATVARWTSGGRRWRSSHEHAALHHLAQVDQQPELHVGGHRRAEVGAARPTGGSGRGWPVPRGAPASCRAASRPSPRPCGTRSVSAGPVHHLVHERRWR